MRWAVYPVRSLCSNVHDALGENRLWVWVLVVLLWGDDVFVRVGRPGKPFFELSLPEIRNHPGGGDLASAERPPTHVPSGSRPTRCFVCLLENRRATNISEHQRGERLTTSRSDNDLF